MEGRNSSTMPDDGIMYLITDLIGGIFCAPASTMVWVDLLPLRGQVVLLVSGEFNSAQVTADLLWFS